MADEATINTGLTIVVGNYQYQSVPQSFTADVSASGAAGPTPGSVLATLAGTLIDLSKLIAVGGLAFIRNTDLTNRISVCMYDPDTARFYPFADFLPGEGYPIRLSRNYQTEYGAGTGTEGVGVQYYARVDPSAVAGTTAMLVVEAFNL